MDIKYWDDRAVEYGHTGWSDYMIYSFDQAVRLKLVEKIIKDLSIKNMDSLDFGTGTGDFANLLSKYSKNVFAYDISPKVINIAKKKYNNENIQYFHAENINSISDNFAPVNLVLSITVLQHIVDDNELINTILDIKKVMVKGGYFISMEYVPLKGKNGSSYQKIRSFDNLLSIFKKCNFTLKEFYGFYHPVEDPSMSYIKYNSAFSVKIVRKLRLGKFLFPYFNSLANKAILKANDCFSLNDITKSSKVMVFKNI